MGFNNIYYKRRYGKHDFMVQHLAVETLCFIAVFGWGSYDFWHRVLMIKSQRWNIVAHFTALADACTACLTNLTYSRMLSKSPNVRLAPVLPYNEQGIINIVALRSFFLGKCTDLGQAMFGFASKIGNIISYFNFVTTSISVERPCFNSLPIIIM